MSELPFEPILGKHAERVEVSNSEIQTFKACRRRWYLGNYLGLGKASKQLTGPLPLGTRIHDALEGYYVKGVDLIDEYNRLQRRDAQLFMESDEYHDEDKIKKFNSESELGLIMLEGYLDWMEEENPDSKIKIISAEEKLEYNVQAFHDSRINIIGKVDMRVQRLEDGSKAIMDHKTAAAFKMYYDTAHMSEQLLLYCLLEELSGDGDSKVDGGIYNLLKKVKRSGSAKPPFYERIDVRFNKHTMRAFWTRLMGTLDDMMRVRDALDQGADHRYVAYPSPTKDCTWICPFFQVCPMMDDGSSADRYLEKFFVQIDPLARYKTEDDNKENDV